MANLDDRNKTSKTDLELFHEQQQTLFRRKKSNLVQKSKSVSSLSGIVLGNKSKEVSVKPKAPKVAQNAKNNKLMMATSGLGTPSNVSMGSLFYTKPGLKKTFNPLQPKPIQTSSNNSFLFANGFLKKPKEKDRTELLKVQKEIGELADSLAAVRKEIANMRENGTRISIEDSKTANLPIVTLTKQTSTSNSRSNSQGSKRGWRTSDAAQKKLTLNKSQTILAPYKFSDAKSEGNHSNDSSRETGWRVSGKSGTEGLVKKLMSQLTIRPQQRQTHQTLDDFVKMLSNKFRSNISRKELIEGEPNPSIGGLRSMLTSLIMTTSTLNKTSQPPKPQQAHKSTQTEAQGSKPVVFGNINLSKTIEELIKKVIIQSKLTKYTPSNLPEYFALLNDFHQLKSQQLSDQQKQALYISIYTLLQKQLLIEVTLEMIKDSGVNIQNLFQFTFSRLGLDYEKYVQFENQRDQDLSARPIFDGELECSFEEPEVLTTQKIGARPAPSYKLDFDMIAKSQDKTLQEELESTKK